MSLRRLGKCASDGLRPRAAKLSRQIRPCSNSRVPLRIVSRFQPRSRSARRCPPDPSSLTVRAMNNRRALPFSALAVSMNKALNESVNSIVGSPALLSLECMIHHLGWFNFCVSLSDEPTYCDNATVDTASHRHLLVPLFSAVRRCPPHHRDPQMYAPGNCVPWMCVCYFLSSRSRHVRENCRVMRIRRQHYGGMPLWLSNT